MRVLLAGASGYIGSQLMSILAKSGHEVIALVRSSRRFFVPPQIKEKVSVLRCDLLDKSSLNVIPNDIDAAYFLVHSMGEQASGFFFDEAKCATNFSNVLEKTACKQLIYLGALACSNCRSEHMRSRLHVEEILSKGAIPFTILKAGIVIGAGSASFEIIRDLVEKLPFMITPSWVNSLCQPIAISDVLFYLSEVLGRQECYGKRFDIGGPEQLTYREMLTQFAKERSLHRLILPVPFFTPRLSSYWLFFVTVTTFSLARALIESLRGDAICLNREIEKVIPHTCLNYREALSHVFTKIERGTLSSSWKSALVLSGLKPDLTHYIHVPTHGCFRKVVKAPYKNREMVTNSLFSIGGERGWYYMDFFWKLRGLLDRLFGGIGLRRGRRDPTTLVNGDVLDFWRVLMADRKKGDLLLYAEMILPGEAWLEYHIEGSEHRGTVTQIAAFRPKGVFGRIYWYVLFPIHYFIFRGLCKKIANGHGGDTDSLL